MTGNDPTDHALAMIASIFEKPAKPEPKVSDDAQAPSSEARQQSAEQTTAAPETPAEADAQADATESADAQEVELSEVADLTAVAPDGTTSVTIATTEIVEITVTSAPEQAAPITLREDGSEDLDALTRFGPGPLDALRFKWSVRHGGGGYYVDETIGTSSQPIVAGPFSRTEAIAFIDGRDRRTRRRFERLRNEIISGPSERGDDEDDETL